MRRLLPATLALLIALTPALAAARAGDGGSFGSRGSRTYSAPPSTGTSPYGASPFQRSITPEAPAARPSPGYGQPGYAQPGYGGSRFGGGGFGSGLLGGLVGAGIGGMLFGNGAMGGISGGASFIGFILQMLLLFWVARFLLRRFFGGGQPAMAGIQNMFARQAQGPGANPGVPQGRGPVPGAANGPALAVSPADYAAFEQVLKDVQAAWSKQDIRGLQSLATPEMVSYFGEQLAAQSSRGVRNTVTDVRLAQGDLAEAWTEGNRQYATVAMRYSMIDVTQDATGRVVDGSPTEHVTATEIWTFLRAAGGRWVLSAIQQTR